MLSLLISQCQTISSNTSISLLRSLPSPMAILPPTSLSGHPLSSSSSLSPLKTPTILGFRLKFRETQETRFSLFTSFKSNPAFGLMASKEPVAVGPTTKCGNSKMETEVGVENGCATFDEMKHRFLSFKKWKFMENLEHFQNLANGQAPKFMVIACADSRVCPSTVLGFQPGEAFIVRNVANMVPPCESGPSETNAALEFAVNSLQVENILVIGHSRCGGIRALMSMQDEANSSSFIQNWVLVGKTARLNTKSAAHNLSFDDQCRHCEKESVNCSLLNLLTYPWIEEKVKKGALSLHGGYYDFIDCTFEKWTLDYEGSSLEESDKFALRNQSLWC
ncbi:beta carbonic anhydrase 5, chloroplastic-like isoform X2 [Mangifera indica]|uniref:beta carbonic anhydrase 5, chloroplastic-like isoform X2 n=1 Tax=Mangifera indica TaxID=29780 RepID=UPI001CFA9000|nr:beta carbonic anhydrase 5, chloroplastic-like isoform X2 [Mangifera indica]